MKMQTVEAHLAAGHACQNCEPLSTTNEVGAANFAVQYFVGAVLAHSFVLGASLCAVMASSRWSCPVPLWAQKTGRQPTMPLNCVIDAAADVCAMSAVDSEETLVEVLWTIRAQFEVADECDEEDDAWVLEMLEHALTTAETDARSALAEVAGRRYESAGANAAMEALRPKPVHRLARHANLHAMRYSSEPSSTAVCGPPSSTSATPFDSVKRTATLCTSPGRSARTAGSSRPHGSSTTAVAP